MMSTRRCGCPFGGVAGGWSALSLGGFGREFGSGRLVPVGGAWAVIKPVQYGLEEVCAQLPLCVIGRAVRRSATTVLGDLYPGATGRRLNSCRHWGSVGGHRGPESEKDHGPELLDRDHLGRAFGQHVNQRREYTVRLSLIGPLQVQPHRPAPPFARAKTALQGQRYEIGPV